MAKQVKTPADIRQSHGRKNLHLQESACLPACLRLCASWHNRIGACLTLDAARFRALYRRLVSEQFLEIDILAAIEAYAADEWHQKNPHARMEFSAWLDSGRFEQWHQRGVEARYKKRQSAVSTQHSVNDMREKGAVHAAIQRGGLDFHAVLRQASLELGIWPEPFDSPRVRARMLEICAGGGGAGVPAGERNR